MNKTTKIIGWIITTLIAALLLISAISKFALPEMAENLTQYGLGDWYIIIGIGELTAIILFIFQSTVLVLIWLTTYLRNPKLFEVMLNKN